MKNLSFLSCGDNTDCQWKLMLRFIVSSFHLYSGDQSDVAKKQLDETSQLDVREDENVSLWEKQSSDGKMIIPMGILKCNLEK